MSIKKLYVAVVFTFSIMYLFCFTTEPGSYPRPTLLWENLVQNYRFPASHSSTANPSLKLNHPINGIEYRLIVVKNNGIRHIGLDLDLAEHCRSQALGNLLEEYLLAYVLNYNLDAYEIRATWPRLSRSEILKRIPSLAQSLSIETKHNTKENILVVLKNSSLNISLEIPLNLKSLYGLDKKELEELSLTRYRSEQKRKASLALVFPDKELLSPYRGNLLIWEKTWLDSLMSGSLYLSPTGKSYTLVLDRKYPAESVLNYLLAPHVSGKEIDLALSIGAYGHKTQKAQISYLELYQELSDGMACAAGISQKDNGDYYVVLIFFDEVTQVRHMLYGSINPDILWGDSRPKLSLSLLNWVVGDAQSMEFNKNKNPLWQIDIK